MMPNRIRIVRYFNAYPGMDPDTSIHFYSPTSSLATDPMYPGCVRHKIEFEIDVPEPVGEPVSNLRVEPLEA